ncbi:MAG: phosphopentomutase [Gemmatimonadaceae bacterium]
MSAPGDDLRAKASTGRGARRCAVIVLDGVGIGAAHDAGEYGDEGSNTLANTAREVGGFDLPHLEAMGLGRLEQLAGMRADAIATAAHGTMQPASAGKDSTTGHWELCGIHLETPFPTYPHGFPADVIAEFERLTGRPVIANVVGSGTAIIERYGDEQVRSGGLIVYTSADSVFQVAAHEDVVPLDELYRACEAARRLLVSPHDVSRVIARPFEGESGGYRRTANRRDFSLEPVGETLLDALAAAGIALDGVGKVDDLFAGRGISSRHTVDNAAGIALIQEWLQQSESGFLFANLVDFDQLFGHRNDVAGFYGALRQFDRALPSLLSALREDDLLFITADHGNDPTTWSSDHARERVPVLVAGRAVRPVHVGERASFADLGATVAEWFGLAFRGHGTSFLAEIAA